MPANFSVSVTISAIDKVTQTLNKVTGNVSKQKGALQAATQNVAAPRSFGSALRGLRQELSGIGGSLEMKRFKSEIVEGTERATKGFRLLGSAARDTFSVITKGGFLLGTLGWGSNRLFHEISRSHTELKHEALQLNMSPMKLRSYRLAAESQGIPESAMTQALSRINDIAFQFQTTGQAPGSLGALNRLTGPAISLLDEHNRIRPSELILGEFLEKLKDRHIPEPAKVQFMSDFLSNSDLMPLVPGGSKGLHSKAQEFQGEDFEKLDQANQKYLDANSKFYAGIDELKRLASIEILPGLTEGIKNVTGWMREHREELRKLFADIGKGLPGEMNSAMGWITGIVRGLTAVSKTVGIANLAFGLFFVGFGAKIGMAGYEFFKFLKIVKNSVVVAQALRGLSALRIAFPFASMLTGYGAIIAGIAVVTYFIMKNRKEIGGWISSWLNYFRQVCPAFDWFVSKIEGATSSVLHFFELMGKPPQLKLTKSDAEKGPSTFEEIFRNRTAKDDVLTQIFQTKLYAPAKVEPAQVNIRFDGLPKGARIESNSSWINFDAGFTPAGVGGGI